MSAPARQVIRSTAGPAVRAGGRGSATARGFGLLTATPSPLPASAALRLECGRQGLARARSFTRETLCGWSLDHCCDDAGLVVTELATNAVTHAAPRPAEVPNVRLGFRLHPAYLVITVSDADCRPPVHTPDAGSPMEEHGRGLRIVDALSEAWGWAPAPPAGKTVWARLSTRPPV
ncbi:ATP-binding protein [Streptomyces sp. GD-15H]|uniref:ATP-binding protein n=1 Tax=Streptomyces sp. GD-15H TaxID=3129112 RepID=UPI0032492519